MPVASVVGIHPAQIDDAGPRVDHALGVALLPSSARQLSTGGVAVVPVAAPCPEVSLHARYSAEAPSPVLSLFLDTVREVAASTD